MEVLNFVIFPALFYGFVDAFNPYALATMLLFFLLLSCVGTSSRLIRFMGAAFILDVFMNNFLLFLGRYDRLIGNFFIEEWLFKVSFVWGLLFLVYGVINGVDWWRCCKRPDPERTVLKLPVFLNETSFSVTTTSQGAARVRTIAIVIGMFVLCMATAWAASLISAAIWPRDFHSFLTFVALLSGGREKTALLFVTLYCLAFILPLIILWLCVSYVRRKDHLRVALLRSIRFVKLVLSALFLSTGTGLVYLFLRQY